MARINIEDGIESKEEFWKLLALVPNRDTCLGMLVRFFRLAQHRYGHDEPLTNQDLEDHGLLKMIEAGWAVKQEDGSYQVTQAGKYFDWYRQRVRSSDLAVDAKRKKREPNKISEVAQPARHRNSAPVNPLALAPSLAPVLAPVLKKNTSASALPRLGQLWNEYCDNFPKIKACSSLRQKHADARWKENPSDEYWINVINLLKSSDFCNGKNDRAWTADFDFFIKPDTHNKALEGKYENRKINLPKTKTEIVSAHNQSQYDRIKKGIS